MKRKVNIENYRGIDQMEINGFGEYNIFVGDNGSCKTTVLEALYICEERNIVGVLDTMSSRGDTKYKVDLKSCFNKDGEIKIIVDDINKTSIKLLIEESDDYFEKTFNLNEENNNRLDLYNIKQYTQDFKSEVILYEENGRLNYQALKIEVGGNRIRNAVFVSPLDRINSKRQIQILEDIVKRKKKDIILNLINKFDSTVKNIEIMNDRIFIDIINNEELVSVNNLGTGVVSILKLLLTFFGIEKMGTVYLDEIEAGIHYLNYPTLAKILVEIASEMNIQIFITTHSDEFLKAFYKALINNNKITKKDEKLKVFQFQKLTEGKITYNEYDMEEIKDVVENGWDIR